MFAAPCVFYVQNNQWAISVPLNKQTYLLGLLGLMLLLRYVQHLLLANVFDSVRDHTTSGRILIFRTQLIFPRMATTLPFLQKEMLNLSSHRLVAFQKYLI